MKVTEIPVTCLVDAMRPSVVSVDASIAELAMASRSMAGNGVAQPDNTALRHSSSPIQARH